MKLLDLYCGAGGSSTGYAQAGFEVTGVDHRKQPRYPYTFVQADVLTLDPEWLKTFDVIHASPPCQRHTRMKTMPNAKEHVDLIPATREMLKASGRPYVIENVQGAPLMQPITLCGTSFGLGADGRQLQRHRCFETSWPLLSPGCLHKGVGTIGIYGGHIRNRQRREGSVDRGVEDPAFKYGCEAMGVDWMNLRELSQAIPPAYTEFLGYALLRDMAQ